MTEQAQNHLPTDVIPRAKLQDLIDAINREGGWRDTDTVGELLTQFLDSEGFTLAASPEERPAATGVPPGRHPNWCRCQGCRKNIARFEAQQFKGTVIIVLVVVAIGLIVMATHAIG